MPVHTHTAQHKAVFTLRNVSAVPLISTRWQTGSLYGRQEVMSGINRKFRVRGESGGSREETLLEEAAEEVIRSWARFTKSNEDSQRDTTVYLQIHHRISDLHWSYLCA